MKRSLCLIGTLGLMLIGQTASAITLTQIEVKTPYLLASCKTLGVDTMSTLALELVKLEALDSDESITLNSNARLLLCKYSVDSLNKPSLNWITVNPFKGYEVQYYDFETNSIKTRKEYIDANKVYNRLEMVILSEETMKFNKANVTPNNNDTFSGQVSINKNTLFNQNDLDLLERGEIIKKKLELYFNSNLTTIVNGNEILLGDQNRSGQNIFLTFKKDLDKVRLINVE